MVGLGRRWRTKLVVGTGVFALAVAYALVALPPRGGPLAGIRGAIVDVVTGPGAETLSWLLAFVAGGLVLLRLGRGRDRPAVAPMFVESPPERATLEGRTTEAGFEAELGRVARFVEDPDRDADQLRRRLGEIAREVLVADGDRDGAERALREGTWTDDRIAAAYLGDEDAPAYPLSERVRGWLRPDLALERRVERTVDAIYERSREG